MRNTRNNTLMLALMMATMLAGSAQAASGDVGTPALDYSLETFGGGNYTLSEQSGQVVIMFVIGFG